MAILHERRLGLRKMKNGATKSLGECRQPEWVDCNGASGGGQAIVRDNRSATNRMVQSHPKLALSYIWDGKGRTALADDSNCSGAWSRRGLPVGGAMQRRPAALAVVVLSTV